MTWELISDVLLDTLIDSAKLFPLLLLTYLAMEFIEHKASSKTDKLITSVGRAGPAVGGLLGVVPQCGFSGAVAGFYAARIVTLGTFISVILVTSDEMLPILISNRTDITVILKLLGCKLAVGIIAGFLIDFIVPKKPCNAHEGIDRMCRSEHCSCNKSGIFVSALKHSGQVIAMIFAVSFVIALIMELIGEENLSRLIINQPFVGELITGLLGIIPNCSVSVILTDLYVDGILSAGALLSGLLVNGGVGILVLFRLNHNIKENIAIVGIIYAIGVIAGMLLGLLPIW